MRLVNPSVEQVIQESGLNGIYKQIELAGRTCYKSEDKITDDSAEKFVERMIKSKHTAMLEHGTLYLDVPMGTPMTDKYYIVKSSIIQFFKHNPYSRVHSYEVITEDADGIKVSSERYAITTNWRVFIEQVPWKKLGPIRETKLNNIIMGLDKDYVLSFMCEPNEHHDKRYSFRTICDRGVTHEEVRHRPMSPAQESTRYCDYMKEKFGVSVSFMQPVWMKPEDQKEFEEDLKWAEKLYFKWRNKGYPPEEARYFLLTGVKSEIVITGYRDQWDHFMDLRSRGTTGRPQPDMKVIGDMIVELFNRIDFNEKALV